MNFKRLSRQMLIAGADTRLAGATYTWDKFWSKCGQPIFLNKDGVDYVYVLYRGMASREWSSQTDPEDLTNLPDRQGISQIGYMRWTAANWPNGAPVEADVAPVLTASFGTMNGEKTPIHAVMSGQSNILKLGEWNDHAIVNGGDGHFYMFVSLFYTQGEDYHVARGVGWPQAPRIIVLRTAVGTFPGGWTYHGTAKTATTPSEQLGGNIGPVWVEDNTFFMLVPDSNGNRVLHSCPTSAGGIGDNWVSRGATFGITDTIPKSTRYKNMIVGRAFKEGSYVYLAMPSAHMFTDWPSAINLYRIAKTACTAGTSAIASSTIEDYPLNPIFQRGPNEGGVWQLCPVCDANGVIKRFGTDQKVYATYQTWSILHNSDDSASGADSTKVIGNPTAKGLRVDDYFGLGPADDTYTKASSTTHKHIGLLEMSSDLALTGNWSSLTAASYQVDTTIRLKNKAHASYLLHNVSGMSVSASTGTPSGTAGWVIRRCDGDKNYVYLHPAGHQTKMLTPSANISGGRRDAGLDMQLVTMSLTDSGNDATDMSWHLAWNKGLGNVSANHPENFHVQWLAQIHKIGTETYLRFENRESSLSLTCEVASGSPTKARQRFPLGGDFELWKVETV